MLVYEPPLLLASLRRIQNDTTGSRSLCENEHCTAAERLGIQLPPRRAARDDFKIATISRAEGGQLQCRVGPLVRLHMRLGWTSLCQIFLGDHAPARDLQLFTCMTAPFLPFLNGSVVTLRLFWRTT